MTQTNFAFGLTQIWGFNLGVGTTYVYLFYYCHYVNYVTYVNYASYVNNVSSVKYAYYNHYDPIVQFCLRWLSMD